MIIDIKDEPVSGMTALSYNQDVLQDTLQITVEFLSNIIVDSISIPDHLNEKEYHWNHKILRITEDVSRFVEITTLLAKALAVKKSIALPAIKDSHIHLLFIIKAMNQAQQKMDYTALEDLIKYELKDNLTQWKIDLIPQLRKQLAF